MSPSHRKSGTVDLPPTLGQEVQWMKLHNIMSSLLYEVTYRLGEVNRKFRLQVGSISGEGYFGSHGFGA